MLLLFSTSNLPTLLRTFLQKRELPVSFLIFSLILSQSIPPPPLVASHPVRKKKDSFFKITFFFLQKFFDVSSVLRSIYKQDNFLWNFVITVSLVNFGFEFVFEFGFGFGLGRLFYSFYCFFFFHVFFSPSCYGLFFTLAFVYTFFSLLFSSLLISSYLISFFCLISFFPTFVLTLSYLSSSSSSSSSFLVLLFFSCSFVFFLSISSF
ncbi:hypothetical protein Kpol_1039p53, partial [Vanderwaltozyma polyspora DSM 70294]